MSQSLDHTFWYIPCKLSVMFRKLKLRTLESGCSAFSTINRIFQRERKPTYWSSISYLRYIWRSRNTHESHYPNLFSNVDQNQRGRDCSGQCVSSYHQALYLHAVPFVRCCIRIEREHACALKARTIVRLPTPCTLKFGFVDNVTYVFVERRFGR